MHRLVIGLVSLAGCQLVFSLDPITVAVDSGGDGPACLDTQGDPFNCGSCGHSCHGGQCSAGVCQPVMLASNLGQPVSIALGDPFVYWVNTTGNSVQRIRKDGTIGVETLVTGLANATDIAVDATHFYWASDAKVHRCSIDGCAVERVDATTAAPDQIALTADLKLWTSPNTGELIKSAKADTSGVAIAGGGQDIKELVIDGPDAFFAEKLANRIRTVHADGTGNPSIFVSSAISVERLAADTDHLYYAGFDVPELHVASRPGGIARMLADGQINIVDIATDGGVAYYIGGGGSGYLRSCAADGCNNQPATILDIDSPVALKLDASDFYYSTAQTATTGTIMRLAR